MPFKKIDVKKTVNEKIGADKEFAKAYEEIKREYSLIEQISNTRKEKGLTQQQLADKVGVSQQVISRFENEKHAPTLDSFLKILDGLDLEITIDKKEDHIKV